MRVIDVDSHITVVKGLEGTPFRVELLSDGGQLMEFYGTQFDAAPPGGKRLRPGKEPIDMRTWWDLDRRLEDLDREGIAKQALLLCIHDGVMFAPLHESATFHAVGPRIAEPAVGITPLFYFPVPYEEMRLKE